MEYRYLTIYGHHKDGKQVADGLTLGSVACSKDGKITWADSFAIDNPFYQMAIVRLLDGRERITDAEKMSMDDKDKANMALNLICSMQASDDSLIQAVNILKEWI